MDASPRIICPHCGIHLVVAHGRRLENGPCPRCGGLIVVEPFQIDAPPPAPAEPRPAQPAGQGAGMPRRRGIPADNSVNFADLERRDTLKTLRMIALFLLVGCVIYLVIEWFSRQGG